MNVGPWEIALIFLVVLLLFGAKRIPEIARGLGKGIREFKDASNDIKKELTITDAPPHQIQPPTHQPMQATPPAQQHAPAPAAAPPLAQQQAPAPAAAPPPAEPRVPAPAADPPPDGPPAGGGA